jgi:hypothetical protein
VTGFVGAPVGDVKFYEGGTSCAAPGTQIGTTQTLNPSGQASVTTSTLSSGAHTIRACYQGTANYATSGNLLTHTVNAPGYYVRYMAPLDESTYPSGTTPEKAVANSAKAGRVIPVKINVYNGTTSLTQADIADGRLTVRVTKMTSCAANATDVIEEYAEAAAGSSNNGDQFRWAESQWIYNLDTKALNLAVNSCYKIDVYLDAVGGTGGTKISTPYYAFIKIVK